jgi:TPR repeat protein
MAYQRIKIIKKQFEYYQSIAANNPEAQFNLGLMHRYGIGTASNQQHAFQYFKQAASNQVVVKNNCEVEVEGMAEAQFHLGQMFRYGLGVDKNLDQALLWFKEAAEQDLKEAQFNAAQLMMTGIGEHYDYDGAIQYYQRAAEQGLAEAQLNLAREYHYNDRQKDYLKAHHWVYESCKARAG